MTELRIFSWLFLIIYIAAMCGIGLWASRRVQNADDFATARASFGPFFLALAFASSAASGATFMGLPALAYTDGVSALWYAFLYPVGVYFGVLICLKTVSSSGSRFGSRSIPEYLGDRYQSNFVRLSIAIFSLMLLFYLSSQLVAGLVMFEKMLGLPASWALGLTGTVLLAYVTLGGAHADILTDGFQGSLMLLIALGIGIMFFFGVGLDGSLSNLIAGLRAQDSNLLTPKNQESAIAHSTWAIAAILIAHIPLGMLPHVGNKLWALKNTSQRQQFLLITFAFGMIMPMMVLGGLLARHVLGDALLLTEGGHPNEAIPALFLAVLPTWLAALLSIAILSAIMSTADGLVISASQVFANDIYRKTLAPLIHSDWDDQRIDRRVLVISRWSTLFILICSIIIGWIFMEMNIAMLLWSGSGGMMAAIAGPLLVGSLWRGVTKAGAITGIISGPLVFIATYIGIHTNGGFSDNIFGDALSWWTTQAGNPFKSTAFAMFISVGLTITVSLVTRPLPKAHLDALFSK